MNITRKNILGVGMDTGLVGLNWLRENTPNTKDKVKKWIDSVEFEIDHRGIEKLEKNINLDTEYIMCFVHFNAGTEELDGIYLSVWDEEATTDDNINSNILDETEKNVIIEYALEELRDYKE